MCAQLCLTSPLWQKSGTEILAIWDDDIGMTIDEALGQDTEACRQRPPVTPGRHAALPTV
jgi:hypothetical protein